MEIHLGGKLSEGQTAIAMIILCIIFLFILYSICRCIGVWTWVPRWFFSSREEKSNLTRVRGHYNANGVFIPSESVVDLGFNPMGNFKRFDSVDNDYTLDMATFTVQPENRMTSNYPEQTTLPHGTVEIHKPPEDIVKPKEEPVAIRIPTPCPSDDEDNELVYPSTSTGIRSSYAANVDSNLLSRDSREPSPEPSAWENGNLESSESELDFEKSDSSEEVEKSESDEGEEAMERPKRPPPPPFVTAFVPLRHVYASAPNPNVTSPTFPSALVPPPIPPRSRICRPVRIHASDKDNDWTIDRIVTHGQGLRRGVSCESITSTTSITFSDLGEPHVTGYLCLALQYNRDTSEIAVTLMEARNLVGPFPGDDLPLNTMVRIYLLPDRSIKVNSRIGMTESPTYCETFMVGLDYNEISTTNLYFYVYSLESNIEILIGEGELSLRDVQPTMHTVTTWVTLTDTGQKRKEYGHIMLSLSYLPSAERLTLVIMKARSLVFPHDREIGNPFVKVYIIKDGKKIFKKKTSTKYGEKSPEFNEVMVFNIPSDSLQEMDLRVTVAEADSITGEEIPLGHVFLGSKTCGKSRSHWIQMLYAVRKPVEMWHVLRLERE